MLSIETPKPQLKTSFLQRLQSPERPVIIFDGAMGTNIQSQNLTAEDFGGAEYEGCNEYLVITKPEAVAKVHRDFLAAGADVVETDSFGSSPLVLAEYDLADRAYELSRKAAELARRCADEFTTPEKPRFVAGSIGPGTKLPTLGHITYDELRSSFMVQAEGLYDGGADLFIVETCQDVLQIKAALSAFEAVFAKKGSRLPLMVSVTMEIQGTMLVGTDISGVLAILEPFPIDILGLNCATGPNLMTSHIKYLSENSPFPISCIPNAGLPENVGGQAVYKMTPEEYTTAMTGFIAEHGVQVVGGCCGTRPAHIQALAEAVEYTQLKERSVRKNAVGELREPISYTPAAASIYSAQTYEQDNSFLIVGERLNASGSKKVRKLLNEDDWDGLLAIAKSQVKEGAHMLDVNVDYVGRDGERDMRELVSRLVTNTTLPLMLDSTEWTKMEAGLKVAGGKCLLNSTNYEDGEERFFKVLELAKEYGAGVVIGCIDEEGMARTAKKKFEIAQRAYEDALKFGIPPHEIFYDTLALPISTGIEEDRENAKATIESIRLIRENLPGVHFMLGVSNISFGLSPATRITLNSVFLNEAMKAGMDGSIVSAAKILPLSKIDEEHQQICRDLIYDKRKFEGDICTYDPLTKLTEIFAGVSAKDARSGPSLADLPIDERLKQHIIDGERIGLEDALKVGLDAGHKALEIINTFLLDGMKVVGELFGSGQMQLPFVLQSAETMKSAVAFLEPYMEKIEGEDEDRGKGKFLIATVKGDVHDIGKNLVDIILTNNGYKVVNLGIKQAIEAIVEAYAAHKPDCIAMSGLLVKSTAFMKENLAAFNAKGITVPVILGGAALTPKFVYGDCQDTYNGQVIYGKDAFADLTFMDRLMPAKEQHSWVDTEGFTGEFAQFNQKGRKAIEDSDRELNGDGSKSDGELNGDGKKSDEPTVIDTKRSEDVAIDIERPAPPFWGTKILQSGDLDLEELFWYMDLQALFAGQWQFRKPKGQSREEYDWFLASKVHPILEEWKEKIRTEKWLEPTLVYGYFPCAAIGNSVHVYEPSVIEQGLTPKTATPFVTWTFPRQKSGRRLCIADFIRPLEQNQFDVLPMQAVTMGEIATEKAQELYKDNKYTDYLYFHGMAVQLAEALAEWSHARIRRELGYGDLEPDNIRDVLAQRYQGSRYSFGYPACPVVIDQVPQLQLLGCDRIGLSMDESEQLYPEQSTTAFVTYHPVARYFSA
ncbi:MULTISPECIES: methionine synthase [unclassified Okeania]|uniref:methionine synthase n=1 Tax=unclassified Okeania TaxID=2634635 RepID=UPI0013BE11FB|nr:MULTISPECIES: methionine synthase [unclassified Okeania]NES76176.1 methionine synthase [Okeania sp. SIO1H4]NET19379.1 methionine synthase [Okeania sp. SIO1H5]NET93262.1 methionine synthase [Okeania sp. SIO1H2]